METAVSEEGMMGQSNPEWAEDQMMDPVDGVDTMDLAADEEMYEYEEGEMEVAK